MRRAWCLVHTVWLSAAVVVSASGKESPSDNPQLGANVGRLHPETSSPNGGSEARSARDPEGHDASQARPNGPAPSHYNSPYTFLQRISRERYEHSEASSDDSTHDDASASEDTWSSMAEFQEEDAVTDVDRMCAPSQFVSPIGKSRGITDAADMMGAFKAFSRQKGNGKRKLLFLMTAGSGEELVGNRQISQRSALRPTVRKKRSGFFNPSDGVGELSDDGRIQVEILHDMLRKFVASVNDMPPEKKKHACLDAFFVSTLQSGVETALEAFSGLLEGLACHSVTGASLLPQDGYLYSNVRLIAAPHLREVVEAEADVGEAFPTVLKKTKMLRMNNGFQRDIFDCSIANYGMQWRAQQLGASGDDELAALRGLASQPDSDEAAAKVLQVLDKFAYPKGIQGANRPEYIRAILGFVKEAARQEASAQRAAWAAPEEMEADSVEPEASVLRRGLSFLRAVCAMGDTTRYMVVSHPKLAERITGHPVDNGELMVFSLDCGAVAECVKRAGLTPSGTSSQ